MLGETRSNYFEANPESYLRLPKLAKFIPVLSPEEAAGHTVKAARQNRNTYTTPFLLAVKLELRQRITNRICNLPLPKQKLFKQQAKYWSTILHIVRNAGWGALQKGWLTVTENCCSKCDFCAGMAAARRS